MIRIACIAATLLTSALAPVQSANAAVNLNGRIQLLTSILRDDAQFSRRDSSFSFGSGSSRTMLFKGIEGVRAITNLAQINSWLLSHAATTPVYDGGTYQFTHTVLDNYFNAATPQSSSSAPLAPPAPSVFEGAPYTFTHTVLDSYFSPTTPSSGTPPPADPAPTVFEGAPYQFTHSVVDSYFGEQSDAPIVAQSTLAEPMMRSRVAPALAPIPEPGTWMMMIGGFAIVGAAMRARRSAPRVA